MGQGIPMSDVYINAVAFSLGAIVLAVIVFGAAYFRSR